MHVRPCEWCRKWIKTALSHLCCCCTYLSLKIRTKKYLLAFIHCSSFTKLLVINDRGSQFAFHQSFAKLMDRLQVSHEGGWVDDWVAASGVRCSPRRVQHKQRDSAVGLGPCHVRREMEYPHCCGPPGMCMPAYVLPKRTVVYLCKLFTPWFWSFLF